MLRKLFLLAVVCISFFQVFGDHGPEKEIQRDNSTTEDFCKKELHVLKNTLTSSNGEPAQGADKELEHVIQQGIYRVTFDGAFLTEIYNGFRDFFETYRKYLKEQLTEEITKVKNEEDIYAICLMTIYVKDAREEARSLKKPKLVYRCIESAKTDMFGLVENETRSFYAFVLEKEKSAMADISALATRSRKAQEEAKRVQEQTMEKLKASKDAATAWRIMENYYRQFCSLQAEISEMSEDKKRILQTIYLIRDSRYSAVEEIKRILKALRKILHMCLDIVA